MLVQNAYLVAIHHAMFRAGEPARILRVVTVNEGSPRACYEVLFSDGKKDFVPLSESENFRILTQDQFDRGEFPRVTN